MKRRPAIVQRGVPPAPAAQPSLVRAQPSLPPLACVTPWQQKKETPKLAPDVEFPKRKQDLGCFRPPVDLQGDVSARDSSIISNVSCSLCPSHVSLPQHMVDVQSSKMPAEGCNACRGEAMSTRGHT